MYNFALIWGTVLSMLSVILGAFGAHGLQKMIPEDKRSLVDTFDTGVRYQMYHGLALFGLGIFIHQLKNLPQLLQIAAWLMITGVVLFSGSIYGLVALQIKDSVGLGKLGIVTPIGGLCLVAAWFCILLFLIKK